MSPVASLNSLANTLAMVYPGANSDLAISGRFPITMVTAMVSPSARPSPRMIPPRIPARALRKTPTRIISQRVAPSASTPSLCCCGTTSSTSRVIDEMMGMIIIARMIPAANMPIPYGAPVNSPVHPSVLPRNGSTLVLRRGTSTNIAQSP